MIAGASGENVGDNVKGLAHGATATGGKTRQVDQARIFLVGQVGDRRQLGGWDAGELGGF
jgi:hypothetical protein